jgi:hypothetical protein
MLSNDQRKLLTTAIAVVVGCALAWYLLVDRNPPKPNVQVVQQLKRPDAKDRKRPVAPAQADEQPRPLPPPVPVLKQRFKPTNLQPLESAPMPATETPEPELPAEEVDPLTPPEPAVPLQVARAALGLVGSDPQAEEIWYQAINDPNMPADSRQDLIEDLNEDGFDDPRQVTEDDLPLIYSRIALIEQVAPDAMDDVNAAAFAEAYKDLVNMVLRLEQEAIAREEAQAAGEDIPAPTPRRPLRR